MGWHQHRNACLARNGSRLARRKVSLACRISGIGFEERALDEQQVRAGGEAHDAQRALAQHPECERPFRPAAGAGPGGSELRVVRRAGEQGARRSKSTSTNSAGSPYGPLTSRGWKIGRTSRSSTRQRTLGSP
jgi:hypothetical protein